MIKHGLTIGLLLAVAVIPALALEVPWMTVDGGGVVGSTGGTLELSGTIGQPDAGQMSGGTLSLTGGFWVVGGCAGSVGPDFDGDCDVDQGDLFWLDSCSLGAAVSPLAVGCEGADLDTDGDADQEEFAIWQRCYSGDNVPATPGCENP